MQGIASGFGRPDRTKITEEGAKKQKMYDEYMSRGRRWCCIHMFLLFFKFLGSLDLGEYVRSGLLGAWRLPLDQFFDLSEDIA